MCCEALLNDNAPDSDGTIKWYNKTHPVLLVFSLRITNYNINYTNYITNYN